MQNLSTDTVLGAIVQNKRLEIAQWKAQGLSDALCKKDVPLMTPGRLESAFKTSSPTPKLMLEIKPASPSGGVLVSDLNLEAMLSAYNQFGVAISVLTDERYFGGSFERLQAVTAQTHLPVLCKDFILDPVQVLQARCAGAAAVLLIVKCLDDETLQSLTQDIRELGMTPLIEVQNPEEVRRALRVDPTILLINNRNLETLEIDLETTVRLASLIPPDVLKVSASGLQNRLDLERFQPFCDGFLVGSALMKEAPENLSHKLRELCC